MNTMTKREIERRLRGKGVSGKKAKMAISALNDALMDMNADILPLPSNKERGGGQKSKASRQ